MNYLRNIGHRLFARLAYSAASIYQRCLMSRLYKRGAHPRSKTDLSLFWIPGGMPMMLHMEGAIAGALKLRGHNVHAVICDGTYTACVKREITDGVPIAEWANACGQCKKECGNVLRTLGVPFSYIGDYLSSADAAELRAVSQTASWQNVKSLQWLEIPIGKNINSAVLRYLKGHDLPTDSRLVQEYVFSGLVCATAAHNAVDTLAPSRMFMSHGVYVDWGPALHTALKKHVSISAWMASYLPGRFYLRHVPDGAHIDFHSMSDDAWSDISAMVLTPEQQARLDDYLADRYQRNGSFDMKEFKPYVGKTAEILSRYRLDGNRPIWGVMAHINWDTVSDYAPMLYESFNEWMSETVEIAKQVPEVQWLVKVHPAEAWDNPDSGVEQLILRKFPKLPDNIRVLSAEENISPLDFYGLVDGAVTVYGTAGLELAMHGKPVILAGEAHYGRKGFTLDADNREEYRKLLQQTVGIGPLSVSQVELAKKYAYCYFILRQIPVSVVFNPDAKWWSFQFDKSEDLLPGKDPAIDFLCERILDGKDFIMSHELEAEANIRMTRKT